MRSAPPSTRSRRSPPPVGDGSGANLAIGEQAEPNALLQNAEVSVSPEVDRVIMVPLARTRCFGLLRVNCPARADSPFYLTARSITLGATVGVEQYLASYYQGLIPETAADVLGLPANHELSDYPPLAAVLPWMGMSPDGYLLAMEGATRGYQVQHDQARWGVTDGHTQFGPVSGRKLLAEVERLCGLVESVRTLGISDAHPPMLGTILVDDSSPNLRPDAADNWVVDVRDGLHRCAVFAALGCECAPVQVVANLGPTTRRSQAPTWHGVLTGLFTEAEALAIFDKYFEGTL